MTHVSDPRFMVFEFTWNIQLRKMQVQLVNEVMSELMEGRSLVKQMIMGNGKTTVVGMTHTHTHSQRLHNSEVIVA